MSSLKRSSSFSNIPRLSRLPVRQSNTSRAPRSSSARPSNVNSNLLTVFGSGTMGRSSSYSNLVTPSRKLMPMTPSSTSSSVSKDCKMHDKDWQKRQFAKVKTFFSQIDPEMPVLKPITIRTYVYSMDILFKQIDSRISITMENYKESVADYLKSFKYPCNLKPSVIKSPAVPSSWQYVLQIWIWLIDLIDVMQSPERILLPEVSDGGPLKFTHSSIDYMAERFTAFNKEIEKEEDVDKEFLEKLAQLMKINLDNVAVLEEEEIYLNKQLESLRTTYGTIELTIQEISEKVSHLRNINAMKIQESYNHRNNLLDQIREFTVKSRNLQANIVKNREEIERLHKIISEQTHTKYEAKQIKNEIEELRSIETHKQQCCKELMRLIEEYDAKLTQQKQMLSSIVYKINNKITTLLFKAPELRDIKIPEEDITGPNFECHIKNFDEKMKKLNTNIKEKLNDLEVRYTTLEREAEKAATEIGMLEMKINEVVEVKRQQENCFNKNKVKYEEEINKMRLNIDALEQERENQLLKTLDIDDLERKHDISLQKEAKLKLLGDKMMSKGKDVIISMHNNIQKIIENQKTAMHKINETREKLFDNIDLTPKELRHIEE